MTCAMPYLPATSSVFSSSRPTSETTSTPSISLDPVEVLDAERAGAGERDLHRHLQTRNHRPAIPTRIDPSQTSFWRVSAATAPRAIDTWKSATAFA